MADRIDEAFAALVASGDVEVRLVDLAVSDADPPALAFEASALCRTRDWGIPYELVEIDRDRDGALAALAKEIKRRLSGG